MRGRLRVLVAGVATILLGGVAACSGDTAVPVPQSSYAPQSATPEVTPSSSATVAPLRNDLAKIPLHRAINAGSITVDVVYNTRLPVKAWRAEAPKPLHISLTSVNKRKRGQKIYLSKVTATVTAYDDRGQVGDSRSVSDTTNITPGFIVTFPNTYNQNLQLPAVDTSSSWMSVDLTYELVLEVDKTKQGNRDFAKQVASDTIIVPLAE
jgi:hypothetical protein